MLDANQLLSNICAEWAKLMQAKLGFFSAIALAALVSGGVVYVWQSDKIWFLEKRIEQLKTDRPRNSGVTGEYHLSSEQWAKFIDAAKVPPGETYQIFIFYNSSCEECAILAQNLLNRLALIPGWTSNAGAGMSDPLVKGQLVQVPRKSVASDEAKSFARALQAAGLNAVIAEEPAMGEGARPNLFIGIPQ